MTAAYVGIDVGGTHTDGVVVEDGRVLHKVKVTTTEDLTQCTLQALGALLEEISPTRVSRVVMSTTLATNAVVEGRIEPTGMILTAGPGVNPNTLSTGRHCSIVAGAVDHRGREIAPLDEPAVIDHLSHLKNDGIRVLASVGKFSVRNPSHELRVAGLAADGFDHVALGHALSGSLNFPRRVATAYLAAGVWRRHSAFVRAMTGALQNLGVEAPLYLLRADGGTHLATAFRNPAETALSGPAASIIGAAALDDMVEETLTLDVGGTTTDISLFTSGVPIMEPKGATIGPFRTQIRSLYTRSMGAGGDSLVAVEAGQLRVGPRRLGPPASMGGRNPTPTDALVLLGCAKGNGALAAEALRPVAAALDDGLEETARKVLRALARSIAAAAQAFVEEVNRKPVYTIHELLEGHRVRPRRVVAVGGPARSLAGYLEEALDLPVHVPNHFDVANAVGAALARVNVEVNLLADSAAGYLNIPEVGVNRKIPRNYSLAAAREEAGRAVQEFARGKGLLDPGAVAEIVEEETFNVVEGFSTTGRIHRIRMQIRPGLLFRVV